MRPAEQLLHGVAPPTLNWPALHTVQAVLPGAAVYWPETHALQVDDALAAEKLPAGQGLHAPAPSAEY